MNARFDCIIVGAGLAGATAAFRLSTRYQLLVLDAGGGSSMIAAGIVNPLAGRRAKVVWGASAALEALRETLEEAGCPELFGQRGVLRCAQDSGQASDFRALAARLPKEATWLSHGAVIERFSGVRAPHGALFVRRGGSLDARAYTAALLEAARQNGAELRLRTRARSWGEEDGKCFITTKDGRIRARIIILALGYGFRHFTTLGKLNLQANKGQLVRTPRPPALRTATPVTGSGYVVPAGRSVLVGTTYERGFANLQPSLTRSHAILIEAAALVPELDNAPVLEHFAGARVTVPGTRLPMVGPIGDSEKLWVLTGMGSKGIMYSALIGRNMAEYLECPETISPQLRISYA